MCFIHMVRRFKVTKERSFQCRSAGHVSLDTIPGICQYIQQSYSNLPPFDVVLQISNLEVQIHLMAEPGNRGSVHLSSKAGGAATALQPQVKQKQAWIVRIRPH